VLYTGEHFVAVMDGVSDRNGLDHEGMSSGRWAALAVADELDRMPAQATLAEAEARLSTHLADRQRALHAERPGRRRAGTTLVCYSRARHELWRIGDGRYAIDGVARHGSLMIDEVALAARWAYVECSSGPPFGLPEGGPCERAWV
jgi:hypothetical protein